MRFHNRKRRLPPAIIIVALIDVLIVLLIFLTVTTTFRQQPAIRLALPESSSAKKTGANEAPPLVITIDAKGELHLGTDRTALTPALLREKLVAAINRNPDLRLAISADKTAPWGMVVSVMDIAKQAKIKDHQISAFTREAGAR